MLWHASVATTLGLYVMRPMPPSTPSRLPSRCSPLRCRWPVC